MKITDTSGPEERELSRLYPGHHFGEYALVREEPRNANVVALHDVKCKYVCRVHTHSPLCQHLYVSRTRNPPPSLQVLDEGQVLDAGQVRHTLHARHPAPGG